MKNSSELSQYSSFSPNFRHSSNYESSTIVVPRRSPLLPSIYEMNSDQRFPNHFILDGFIYGDMHNEFITSEAEQPYQNNLSTQMSENNEKSDYKITLRGDIISDHINDQKLQNFQYNQRYDYSQQINNDVKASHCCSITCNQNDLQLSNNGNLDARYLLQYRIPYNSIPTQMSENTSPLLIDQSNCIEVLSPQCIQSTKMNFLNITNRIDNNSQIILDPIELKFIPADQWVKGKVSLEKLKKDFFCARSSKCLRFEYKLWNALQITKYYPHLFKEIGVKWISKSYIMVHRDIFGHLLQVTRPSAALFSSCGMFMTHGFREIMLSEVRNNIDPNEILSIDESIVRLFAHKENDFNEDSGAADINKIKWNNESRKKTQIGKFEKTC